MTDLSSLPTAVLRYNEDEDDDENEDRSSGGPLRRRGHLVAAPYLIVAYPSSNYWSWLALMRAHALWGVVHRGRAVYVELDGAQEWIDIHGLPTQYHPGVIEAARSVQDYGPVYAKLAQVSVAQQVRRRRPTTPGSRTIHRMLTLSPDLAGFAPCDLTMDVARMLVRRGYPSPDEDDMDELSRLLWMYTRSRQVSDKSRRPVVVNATSPGRPG